MNVHTTKVYNKLALLLLVLYLLSLSVGWTTKAWQLYAPGFPSDALTIQTKILHLCFYLFQMLVYIGSAIWLFMQSKKTGKSQWVWAFLGLFSGVLGLILWFLFQINEKMEKQISNS